MPNVSPKDYLPRIDHVLGHWEWVDSLVLNPVELPGSYTRRRLVEDRESLGAQIDVVETIERRVSSAITERNSLRAAISERQRQFNAIVRAVLPESPHAGRLVRVPVPTSGPSVWMTVVDEVAEIWDEVEDFTSIRLADGYTRNDFEADRTNLRIAYEEMNAATLDYRAAAESRDALWAPIYQRLRTYRLMVQGLFSSESDVVEALPKLVKPYKRTRTS